MTTIQRLSTKVELTQEQAKEGYWVEEWEGNVLVWHHNCQVALLCSSPDIDRKVQEVVERRRQELMKLEAKYGRSETAKAA